MTHAGSSYIRMGVVATLFLSAASMTFAQVDRIYSEPLTWETMYAGSALIVDGEVASLYPVVKAKNGDLQDVAVTVRETLKGERLNRIVVAESQPQISMRPSQRYILFLIPASARTSYPSREVPIFKAYGNSTGRLLIENGKMKVGAGMNGPNWKEWVNADVNKVLQEIRGIQSSRRGK